MLYSLKAEPDAAKRKTTRGLAKRKGFYIRHGNKNIYILPISSIYLTLINLKTT